MKLDRDEANAKAIIGIVLKYSVYKQQMAGIFIVWVYGRVFTNLLKSYFWIIGNQSEQYGIIIMSAVAVLAILI